MKGKSESAVTVTQYDERVKRRSLDDPLRQHRQSSIPFVDRKPAVKFLRSIDQREASVAGPNEPAIDDNNHKPILKKSNFPIFITNSGESGRSSGTTNDELENCKIKADLIMDKISRAERTARGSMDVMSFPTSTHRVEALSRYQGNMTISVCTLESLTASSEFRRDKTNKTAKMVMQSVLDLSQQMANQAVICQSTAKKFLGRSKYRYNECENLLKRNIDFKVDHSKLSYPIYIHKRMPESVTMLEDFTEDSGGHPFDGFVRISRTYPQEVISLHYDSPDQSVDYNSVKFHECSLGSQAEVVKLVVSHGKDMLLFSDTCLNQGLEVLADQELDEAFETIRNKIDSLEYDDKFDSLCALELKNALGELVARKAELLNTAEQIVNHYKHVVNVAKMFNKYAKNVVQDGRGCGCTCMGSTKHKLLHLLGMFSSDDVKILLPLTLKVAKDIFDDNPSSFNADNFDSESTADDHE